MSRHEPESFVKLRYIARHQEVTAPDGEPADPGGVFSIRPSLIVHSETGTGASTPVTLSQLLAGRAVKPP